AADDGVVAGQLRAAPGEDRGEVADVGLLAVGAPPRFVVGGVRCAHATMIVPGSDVPGEAPATDAGAAGGALGVRYGVQPGIGGGPVRGFSAGRRPRRQASSPKRRRRLTSS